MPLGGCGLTPQNEFEGSTPLVASACWGQRLWPLGPQVPSSPTRDGKFGGMYTGTMPCLNPCRQRCGCLSTLNTDHEGGGDHGQQGPLTRSQAVPLLQDQLLTAPSGPVLLAQATFRQQEAPTPYFMCRPSQSPGLPK